MPARDAKKKQTHTQHHPRIVRVEEEWWQADWPSEEEKWTGDLIKDLLTRPNMADYLSSDR